MDLSPLTEMLVLKLGDDNGNIRSKSLFIVLVLVGCTVAGCTFIFMTCFFCQILKATSFESQVSQEVVAKRWRTQWANLINLSVVR